MMRGFLPAYRNLIVDGLARWRRAWMWIVLEIVGVALLVALGLLWTRIPEKHTWQVLLTLVVPLIVAAAFLALQAETVRAFLRREAGTARVSLAWGAATLLIWIAIGWLLWALLDRFDDHTFNWAMYLNSKASEHARVHWASYQHINRELEWVEWTLRWVIVPGLLVPLAFTSAWGFRRLPWRRVLRLFIDWRWWPVVLACALVAEAWPQTWFEANPHGSVHAQVTRVLLKVVLAYLLAIVCWMDVIAWAAMLLDPAPRTGPDDGGEPVAPIAGPRNEKQAAVPLPLPDTNQGVGGNA